MRENLTSGSERGCWKHDLSRAQYTASVQCASSLLYPLNPSVASVKSLPDRHEVSADA